MSKWHLNLSVQLIEGSALAVGVVLMTTGLFLLIGRNVLGEGVIALLYLVPIGWSTTRWGQLPGTCAALTAALTFDYFFIPPFYTFAVGTLEGWLLLIIFLVVATVIIGARDEAQLRQNLGSTGWNLTQDQVARLDAASETTLAYPYWHQRGFNERNPFPTLS